MHDYNQQISNINNFYSSKVNEQIYMYKESNEQNYQIYNDNFEQNKYNDALNIHLPLLNKDSEYMNDFYKKNDLTDLSTFYSLLFINYLFYKLFLMVCILQPYYFLKAILQYLFDENL